MSYRCYLLDEFGRIMNFVEFEEFSDSDAIGHATRHAQLANKPFELWRGRQQICPSPNVFPGACINT